MAPTLDDVVRALHKRPATTVDQAVPREASVAALLLPDLDVLFIRRAEHEGDPWSGHVAFPGGKREVDDADPVAAAVRETREELGLDLSGARLLGPLDELATFGRMPSMVIRPYVFSLDRVPDLTPNHEVRSVHRAALSTLLEGHGRSEFQMDWRGNTVTLPQVEFDGVKLWGLTLRVVDDLLHRIDGRGVGLARPRR